MSVSAQVIGVTAALCGLWVLAGPAWVLLVGGVLIAVVGVLWEAGKL